MGKAPERPQLNGAELKEAIHKIVEMNMGAISDAYRRSVIYGSGAYLVTIDPQTVSFDFAAQDPTHWWPTGYFASEERAQEQEERNQRFRDLVERTRNMKGQP